MDETKKELFSEKIKRLFRAIEFRFVVFLFSLLVLSGPFVVFSKERALHFPFLFYWISWIGIIFFIAIMNFLSSGDDNKTNI